MKTTKDYLTDEQINTISAAITTAEQKTCCELIPVLALRAGAYEHAIVFVGFLSAILGFVLAYQWLPVTSMSYAATWQPHQSSGWFVLVMFVSFIVGGLVARAFPVLTLPFISQQQMKQQVQLRTYQAYMDHCNGKTTNHAGIVIFVSLFEHRVTIQGDTVVNQYLGQADWQAIKDTMLAKLKRGALCEAFISGLLKTGELAHQQLPATGDVNQVANELHFL